MKLLPQGPSEWLSQIIKPGFLGLAEQCHTQGVWSILNNEDNLKDKYNFKNNNDFKNEDNLKIQKPKIVTQP